MSKKPNISGGGANTNINGLSFEGRTNLLDAFKKHENFQVNENKEIMVDGIVIGLYVEKHDLYKKFLKPNGVKWEDCISSKLLPDSVFINYITKTIYIGEKKFQENSGSVDEKLQTGLFKKEQYIKLMMGLGYKVEYYFLLNDWFLKEKYRDVKEFIVKYGCKYFINEIPFNELGL